MINAEDRIPRRTVRVVGRAMSVAVAGERSPNFVFLHGNATYSYMWRNLIPYIAQRGRCLAPDLLGMGRSEVIFPSGASSYDFADQASHIELLIEMMVPDGPIVLIGHELGATMAVQFARKYPGRVAGIVLVEGVFRISNDAQFDTDVAEFLAKVRSDVGEDFILTENALVERYLPRLTSRSLGPTEMAAYRAPYPRVGESRRAMLSMIRQLPLQSSPGPIDHLIEQSRLWCAQSRIPKLVIGGSPGLLVPAAVLGTAARWHLSSVASVRGLHFLTEDSPARITTLILDWLTELGM
ncbi:MAG: haloalkane dehalogenase [Acidimicrobiia bacterium]